jgi:hypothetical protein
MPQKHTCQPCEELTTVESRWYCKTCKMTICSQVLKPTQLKTCPYRPSTDKELLQKGVSIINDLNTESAIKDFDRMIDFMYPTLMKKKLMYDALKMCIQQRLQEIKT